MTTDLASIAAQLAALQQQNEAILGMLRQLVNPAATADVSAKARLIMEAQRSGDRKRLREVLKLINA
jgi:hypothetical protein